MLLFCISCSKLKLIKCYNVYTNLFLPATFKLVHDMITYPSPFQDLGLSKYVAYAKLLQQLCNNIAENSSRRSVSLHAGFLFLKGVRFRRQR